MPAKFLCNLTKNLTVFLPHNLCAVLPKEYFEFILEQLSELEDVSYRQMMVYYKSKIFGGIYDDRFLVKPVKSAIEFMPEAEYVFPYESAKKCLWWIMLTARNILPN